MSILSPSITSTSNTPASHRILTANCGLHLHSSVPSSRPMLTTTDKPAQTLFPHSHQHHLRSDPEKAGAAPAPRANHQPVTPRYLTHTPPSPVQSPSLVAAVTESSHPRPPSHLCPTLTPPWRNTHCAHTRSSKSHEALPDLPDLRQRLTSHNLTLATSHLFSYTINGMATRYPKPTGQPTDRSTVPWCLADTYSF